MALAPAWDEPGSLPRRQTQRQLRWSQMSKAIEGFIARHA
jgi:hypothetical protein